jgi:hypothetical protein
VRTWQRWLIALVLTAVVVAVVIIATIVPHGIIAPIVAASVAIVTLLTPVGGPLVRWLRRRPAPKITHAKQRNLPISSPASRLRDVAKSFDRVAEQYPAGSRVGLRAEDDYRPLLLGALNGLQRTLDLLTDADVNACLDRDSAVVICMIRNRAKDQVAEIQAIIRRDENAESELRRLVESLKQMRDFIRGQVPI